MTLATKVAGRSERTWLRPAAVPETRLSREQILAAVDGSRQRLRTDYIDYCQVHWPDRKLGLWGEGGGSYVHKDGADAIPILDPAAPSRTA